MATFNLDPYQGSSITAFVPDLRVKNNNTGVWSHHIQTSIDNAGTDNIIFVTAGIYYENVVVWARLILRTGNAMTQAAPDDVQHAVDTGGSGGYATMDEFMEEDSAKEQEMVERANTSVFSLAINNWFGLKSYIMSFFPKN